MKGSPRLLSEDLHHLAGGHHRLLRPQHLKSAADPLPLMFLQRRLLLLLLLRQPLRNVLAKRWFLLRQKKTKPNADVCDSGTTSSAVADDPKLSVDEEALEVSKQIIATIEENLEKNVSNSFFWKY